MKITIIKLSFLAALITGAARPANALVLYSGGHVSPLVLKYVFGISIPITWAALTFRTDKPIAIFTSIVLTLDGDNVDNISLMPLSDDAAQSTQLDSEELVAYNSNIQELNKMNAAVIEHVNNDPSLTEEKVLTLIMQYSQNISPKAVSAFLKVRDFNKN